MEIQMFILHVIKDIYQSESLNWWGEKIWQISLFNLTADNKEKQSWDLNLSLTLTVCFLLITVTISGWKKTKRKERGEHRADWDEN